MTTVHSPFDNRIFHKECRTLVDAGYAVSLIAQHEKDEIVDGIKIIALLPERNRFHRMSILTLKAWRTAIKQKADIYHFHDPELIFIGILLKLMGKKVIYDIHEDYTTAILIREYLPKFIRKIMVTLMKAVEGIAEHSFALVLAERYYRERFPGGITVLNYPLNSNVSPSRRESDDNSKNLLRLLYTGNLSKVRGALIYPKIINDIHDVEVHCIGKCSSVLAKEMLGLAGENSARLHMVGVDQHVPYERILQAYSENWLCGLAFFYDHPQNVNKELTKIFEYMSAGIPVVASNFPVWKKLIEENGCGICVDPFNQKEIANAIKYLIENQDERRKFGGNGRRLVLEKYNWDSESKKLLKLYEEILAND